MDRPVNGGVSLLVVLICTLSLVGAGSVQAQESAFQSGLQSYVQNDYERAIRKFRRAVNEDSTVVKYQFFLGNAAIRLGDTRTAFSQYRKVLELDPYHTTAREKLARLYFRKSDWRWAEKHFRRLAENDADTFRNRLRLGITQFKLGKLRQSEEKLIQVLHANPTLAPAHFYLGRIQLRRGNYRQSAKRLSRAIELNSSNGRYRYYRALANFRGEDYMNESDTDWQSARGFQRALRSGFDSPKTRFMYSNSMLNRGLYYLRHDRVEDGVQLLKKSIEQFRKVLITEWNASNAYHNMGVAYLAIGKLDLARQAVEQAILAEPSAPFFHDTLGEIFYRLGEFQKAIESWNLARELEPRYRDHPFEPLYFRRSLDNRIREAKLRQ